MIIKRTGHVGRPVARYLLVGAMSAVLVGCGGGGGDSDPIDTDDGDFSDIGDIDGDVDGDGTPNSRDPDYASDIDGDDIPNFEDDDFDGTDIDGDGFLNLDDGDVDGDGVVNEDDDDFVEDDADGDGFTDVSASAPCGGAGGTDPDSSNNTWDDNCGVSRFGQFEDSLYTAGIQRVVYCSGFGEAASVDAFADGDGGPATFGAVEAYQEAEPDLTADGIVGANTWGSLQSKLELVEAAEVFTGEPPYYDSYTVAGERCDGEVLFYQEVTRPESVTGQPGRLGWELSSSAGSDQRVPFSIELTSGRLD